MRLIISLSFLPHQPKKPCGIRPLIYFCLQITTTSLWLILRCRYQKSIINIRTNLMSTEDPEPGKKAREGRLYQAHGLVSISSVCCELNLSGATWILFFEFQITDELPRPAMAAFYWSGTMRFYFPSWPFAAVWVCLPACSWAITL